MTYDEIFRSMCEDQTIGDVGCLAGAFEAIVDELEFQDLREGSLAYYAVGEYLCLVNWEEIAEHLAADYELFQEEEEVERLNNCDLIAD